MTSHIESYFIIEPLILKFFFFLINDVIKVSIKSQIGSYLVIKPLILDSSASDLVGLGGDDCSEVTQVSQVVFRPVLVVGIPEDQGINFFGNIRLHVKNGQFVHI